MGKDISWKEFFSDNARYADIINGICGRGKQIVSEHDLKEMDTQVWERMMHDDREESTKNKKTKPDVQKSGAQQDCSVQIEHQTDEKFEYQTPLRKQWEQPSGWNKKRQVKWKGKNRDLLRKAAFGMNFIIVGIENQEAIDYALPLRCMVYDIGEYQKQAADIRRRNRKYEKQRAGIKPGEYLYGFRKTDHLQPCITFVLYSGTEKWDAARSIHELLDMRDIPAELREMVQDYKIHLISVRDLDNTEVFRTDVKQVFDFIRYSGDKEKLRGLIEKDSYYQEMDEDAFDVAVHYTNLTELIGKKDVYKKKGNIDMCKAVRELIEDGRTEGRKIGLQEGMKEGIQKGITEGKNEERIAGIRILIDTCREFGASREQTAEKVAVKYNLDGEEAAGYLKVYWKSGV